MARILCIGNALVDHIVRIPDDKVLEAFSLPRGSMTLVDQERSRALRKALKDLPSSMASGGSAANTARGLAGFLGSAGDDDYGQFFYAELEQAGVEPQLLEGSLDTGVALTLISPDSERTFATYLGSASELSASDIDEDTFASYDLVHLEGYLVQDHQLFESILELAAEEGLMVSVDLASYNVVQEHIGFLRQVLPGNVDIVFANAQEAQAYTGEKDPRKALAAMNGEFWQVVVKTGDQGCLVSEFEKTWAIPAEKAEVTDTNGAGDLFASGYLAGWAFGRSPEECALIGTRCAARVIGISGTTLPTATWEELRQQSAELLVYRPQ
ncbi:MAG TPA: adenosine kinase [Bacteroidales bacterium]|nr:adenosine kinase [Bacteroidales bacterium]